MPYNPAESRDGRGRWTSSGDGFTRGLADSLYPWLNPLLEDVDFSDGFHDFIVKHEKEQLEKAGAICVETPMITTLNGEYRAFPDLVCKPRNGSLRIVEVKTGFDPGYSKQQEAVYAMAQFDNHTISASNRLAQFGYPKGSTLPAMHVFELHVLGPGMKKNFDLPFIWLRGQRPPVIKKAP